MLKNYDDETTTTIATATKFNDDEEQTTATTADSIAEAAEEVVNYSADGADSGAAAAAVQDDASLTIENNEETETNDNFNESSSEAEAADNVDVDVGDGDAATAVEMTKDSNVENENVEDERELSSTFDELNSQVLAAPVTSAPLSSAIETFDYEDAASHSAPHLRYAANLKKEREHFASSSSSSSDDEDAVDDGVEMNPTFNSEWEHLTEELAQTNDDHNNNLSNDIDVYASVPIDLSNDIAVNEIAAAQADFPVNPDAEFIDIDGVTKGNSDTMPQFEKLSMSTGYQTGPIVEMLAPAK